MSRFPERLTDRYHSVVDLFTDEGVKRKRMTDLVRLMRPFDCGRPLVRVGGAGPLTVCGLRFSSA